MEYSINTGFQRVHIPSAASTRKEFLYRTGCNKEDRECFWEGEAEAREGHCLPVTVGNGEA